ncbi:MAG TPA: FG-GAP-like repeat-containing protein, partial [Gemmataceae bacterium]|nr:FG-GAP-like repeat-containing protein [Gemmataceae bacterium]
MEDRLTPSVSFVLGNPVPAPPSSMLFTVTRTGDLTPAVQVNYTTLDGSGSNAAHAGTDYTATSGTLLFPANQTTETISVPVLNDTVFQANLTFGVVLSSPLASAAFAGPQSFPAIGGTVAVGDLNGDGKPDLVVANSGDNTVLVLLNTTARGATTPNFAPLQSFATGSRPFSVTVADVNSDGKPDLITANYSDTVSVLLNTTAPGATTLSFAPQQSFATGSGLFSVAVADINGDGLPDLITSNKWDQTVGMLLNTTASGASTPSFGPQQTLATGIDPSSNLAVADVNGDGLPDLLVVSGIDSLWVVLNTTAPGATTASFAPPQTFNTGSSSGQVSLAVADVNLDGKPDIIATGTQVSAHGDLAYMVSVLLNTTAPGATTASFAPQQTFPTSYNRTSVAVADVNGDGLPDLVVAGGGTSPGGALSVLLNTMVPGAAVPSFAPQQTFPTGSYPSSVAVADVNGDALPDIVTANGFDGTVSVLLNTTAPVNFAAVQAVSVTAITSVTPARAVLGQTFTVSAIVTPGLPQPNAPTGTVTFFDDTTPLGVVPIGSDGIATLTVSAHHGGTLSLRATYSGDVNFLPSETAVTPLPVLAQNTVGVFDPATGTWYLRGSNSPGVPDAGQFAYGAPGWVGVPGDWNGDGVSTVGVFDPGTAIWYLR